jgi:hypothetical protein
MAKSAGSKAQSGIVSKPLFHGAQAVKLADGGDVAEAMPVDLPGYEGDKLGDFINEKMSGKPDANETEAKSDVYKGNFNQAFASARADGHKEFTWNGKRYGTQMASEVKKPEKAPESESKYTPPEVPADPQTDNHMGYAHRRLTGRNGLEGERELKNGGPSSIAARQLKDRLEDANAARKPGSINFSQLREKNGDYRYERMKANEEANNRGPMHDEAEGKDTGSTPKPQPRGKQATKDKMANYLKNK